VPRELSSPTRVSRPNDSASDVDRLCVGIALILGLVSSALDSAIGAISESRTDGSRDRICPEGVARSRNPGGRDTAACCVKAATNSTWPLTGVEE
jgi:hypothetical protein